MTENQERESMHKSTYKKYFLSLHSNEKQCKHRKIPAAHNMHK